MRRIAFLIAALVAVIASRAEAESQWREYAFQDQQFAAAFPAPPEVMRIPFESASGRRVREVVYYLQQDSERFQVAVFDLLSAGINEPTAIASAVASMREKGEVKVDIVAEVQGHWGHFLSLETQDGRHIIAGVFFRNERLYEIEASAPASDFEAVSSDLVRFQQSLRFIGTLRSRRFVPPPAEGFLPNLGGRLFGPDGSQR
ncbi:MAG TPA: hypothetical protein VK479_14705 [Micropepsaceae bacterium]|nr:hypothetical protein [Micropepsaceae bacterium]